MSFMYRIYRVVLICLILSVTAVTVVAQRGSSVPAPATAAAMRPMTTRPAGEADLQVTEEEFTIIALPDTQVYSQKFPQIFLQQTDWIARNAGKLHLACVIHEGDITQRGTDAEWQAALRALSRLDGVIPYCIAPGNHDLLRSKPPNRWYDMLDQRLPFSKFQEQPWFAGAPGKSIRTAAYKIEAQGLKLLVVCLEYGAPDSSLAWANEIVAKNPDRQTIIVTHNYMYDDDTRSGPGDLYNPKNFNSELNDGEDIWEKLVRRHKNIFLVLSGHVKGSGTGRLTSTGDHGNAIHQILANYQMRPEGGGGYLRILRFSPAGKKIFIRTFSPYHNAVCISPDHQFDLDWASPPR